MSEGLLTGTSVTVTFIDDSMGVVVTGSSRTDTVARLNTILADGESYADFISFEAVDTDATVWWARSQIAAIIVEPVTLADLGSVYTYPKDAQES